MKASRYISGSRAKCAFVSTKSICQGEQVSLLWPLIFEYGVEISFAYKSFNWSNSAKDNAGVTCIIIGLRNFSNEKKIIYSDTLSKIVKNISPYLIDARNVWVTPRSKTINGFPVMCMGSNPVDGKNLVVEKEELEQLKEHNDSAVGYIRRYVGGSDFLYGKERYCLWIPDDQVESALLSPFIYDRIQSCKAYRGKAGRDAKKVADVPHRFCYRTHKETSAIIFPKTTTERRLYVPCGYTQSDTIINVDAFAIYDADLSIFSLLSSRMHVIWFSTTSGKLRTGHRYSVKMSYNTFPVSKNFKKYKDRLIESGLKLLSIRENYPDQNLAGLYDPDKMPNDLLIAHQENDLLVESMYSTKKFINDEGRLEAMFHLYEKMVGGKNA